MSAERVTHEGGGPVIIVRPPIFKMEDMAVGNVGEDVLIKIGNDEFRFPYQVGLWLAQHIRVNAKAAKRRAGDNSRHWSAVATLDGIKQ